MPLQTSGAISLSNIDAELKEGKSIGNYRGKPWYTPQGGSGFFNTSGIKFSDFYDKSTMQILNAQHIAEIRDACMSLYFQDPSVILSVVASGGNLATLYNTYLHGDYSGVTVSSVAFNRLYLSYGSEFGSPAPDLSNMPRYFDGTQLRVMTLDDIVTHFIEPVGALAYNPYLISAATSLAEYNLRSTTPIFSDTRAISGSNTLTTVANYYLYGRAPWAVVDLNTIPSIINFASPIDANVQFRNLIRHCLLYYVGYRLQYNINGNGTTLGTVMTDTRLNSQQKVTIPATQYSYGYTYYRPYGSATTISTYSLKATVV